MRVSHIFKCPARDACLYMGGNQAPPAPCFPDNSVIVGRILFKFGRCIQWPWGIF